MQIWKIKCFLLKNLNKSQRYKAFTLAEVLIVLGIIGIVAECLIPTLIQDVNEKDTVGMLKKEYSILSQAYTFAVMQNGDPTNWSLGSTLADPNGASNLLNILSPILKIVKNCGVATNSDCYPSSGYTAENGTTNILSDGSTGKAVLADGSTVYTYIYNGACNYGMGSGSLQNACGEISVDINGRKGPNKLGVDAFIFYLTKNGISPVGTALDTAFSFDGFCKDKSKGLIEGMGYNGAGCTAWVLYNENMDYLHCSDLSWDGKHKCS